GDRRRVAREGAGRAIRGDAERGRPGRQARGDQTLSSVAVIGAGPAGLMASEVLARGGASVTVYDAMASAGRKFLMAGRGGLNLTPNEALSVFLPRYRHAAPQLRAPVKALSPGPPRPWGEGLGRLTLVGQTRTRVSP